MKKSLYCPICGSQGEDLAFAFYCMNIECQNFRDDQLYEVTEDYDDDCYDETPFWGDSYWPYEID